MKKILVSGLINTETTVKIKQFPIEYFPIDYSFFGVNTRVSGVAYNLAKALKTLGDDVIACNTNFNRELLRKAKSDNKIIVTDVHVLADINDDYNREFMQFANILFLSVRILREIIKNL